ncbi:MAG: trypsin-like peptidase domain-containing protein [Anaerolineae bacterium]|nr:trypsin-like peptidase domain-containing protein [Anaerolineae bacterium]
MKHLLQRVGWMLTGAVTITLLLGLSGLVALPEAAPTVGAQGTTAFTQTELQLVDLYTLVNPSVVSIQVRQAAGTRMLMPEFEFPDIPGMPRFELPDEFKGDQGERYVYGQGSGFLYDTDGHIVTNYHVAGEADQIQVIFADGSTAEAELIGTDPDSDLAVIKVDPADLPDEAAPLPLADSDALQVGQTAVAIGNPYGLSGTMTTGIVSALDRSMPSQAATADGGRFNITDVIQTDAAINPGNSGGPLLNLSGEVIGVNTAIESSTRQNAGIGFAVPSNTVATVVPVLIEEGAYAHPWLGISGMTVSGPVREAMELPDDVRGVLIASVDRGGPAARAGLLGSSMEAEVDGSTLLVGGDIIIAVDDRPVNVFEDLLDYVSNRAQVGQEITLRVLRNGVERDVPVTLAARPTSN